MVSILLQQQNFFFQYRAGEDERRQETKGKRASIKDESVEEAEKLFITYDTDGNGTLDRDEFAVFYREILASYKAKVTDAEIDAAILLLDEDKNNVISLDEFTNWWRKMHVGRNAKKPLNRFVTPPAVAQTESNPSIQRTNRPPPSTLSHDIYSSAALPLNRPPPTATPPRNAEFTKPHAPPPVRNRSNTTGSPAPPAFLQQSVSSGAITRGNAPKGNVPPQSSPQLVAAAPLNPPPQLQKPPQQPLGRSRSPTGGPPPGYSSPNRSGSEEHIKPPTQPVVPSFKSSQSSDTITRRPKPPQSAPRGGNALQLPLQPRDKPPQPQQERAVPPLVSPRNNVPASPRANAVPIQPMVSPRYFQASPAQPPPSQPPKRGGPPNPRGQPPPRGAPNPRGRGAPPPAS